MAEDKKLYRSRSDRILFGVCGGLGEYFNIDPTFFRIGFVLLVLADGIGILLYLVFALIIRKEPRDKDKEKTQKADKKIGMNARNALGFIVVLIGISLLAKQYISFNWVKWNIVLPVIIILFGAILILRSK